MQWQGDALCTLGEPPLASNGSEFLQFIVQQPPNPCMTADEESQLNLDPNLDEEQREQLLTVVQIP